MIKSRRMIRWSTIGFIFILSMLIGQVSAQEPTTDPSALTATTKNTTTLWSGPGNISCYSNMGVVTGGETVTLLGYAPAQCYPSPNHDYYYIRRANGTEGWILDSILNLPWGVESLPILSAPPTATPTSTPSATPSAYPDVLTATTKNTTTLWSGPGNISCYSNMGVVTGGETVTLLGYAPAQCYPYPNHSYYYIQRANGTEGWILDSILNLPWGVESLPILSAPPTATPTSTPSATPSAYPDVLTATTKNTTTLWSGPGNISCYSNMGVVTVGETVTLLGYAPAQCYPYPNHDYYYIRRANGTEGWILDSILNLPWGVESLPILTPATPTPSPTATATRTPLPSTATSTNTPVPPTATSTPTSTNTPVPSTATSTATSTNTPVPPTATSTPTSTNTPIPPTATATPTSTNTPIPPTATPIPVTLKMELQVTTDNNQQSQFHYHLTNLSGQTQSGLSVRLYFTTESGNAAANYTLEKYWDQSGSAVISGPTLAGGDTYYFTISYAGALSASSTWEYAGALHLANWGSTYSSTNDFWISGGSSGSYIETYTLPIFQSGLLVLGNMP